MTGLLAVIADRLQTVKWRGSDQFTACCPAHEDRTPSLSVKATADRILMKCHAGCRVEAICAAIDLTPAELFFKPNGHARQAPKMEPIGRRIVATYDYTDQAGKLLYQTVRYAPKDFKQRRPDGSGGWIWNLEGVRLVLFNLPEVIHPGNKTILICEGEKDAIAAHEKNGLCATTNPMGAGKWRPEYSEFLRGKNAIIFPHNDKPGPKGELPKGYVHAQQVATSLYGIAESVKVCTLPPQTKDFADWNVPGDEMARYIAGFSIPWTPHTAPPAAGPESVPVGAPSRTTNPGFSLTSLKDLLKEPEEKVSWLLAEKLPAGGISVLSAKPKVGKSTFARCLALAVARGEQFLGSATTKGPVIYLALEEKRSEVRRHFADLGANGEEGEDQIPIHIHCAAAPKDAMSELCKIVTELKPVLVIIDPLFKFVRVVDEKAYAEMCYTIAPFLTLARETGTHVLLVHHSGKAERADAMDAILGSTAIFGGVDTGLILKRTDRYRTLLSRQKYGTDWPETVLQFDSETRALSLGVEKSEAEAERISHAILVYLRASEEPRTREEIEAQVEGKTGPARMALRLLVEGKQIVREGTGRRGDPFKYRFLFSCSPHIQGTREQETEKGRQVPANIQHMLVPGFQQNLFLVPGENQDEKVPRVEDSDEVRL